MTRHPFGRLLLVAALIVPMTGVFALEYTCEMDGGVHRSRCCEKKADAGRDSATLSSPDCCQVRPAPIVPATKGARMLAGDQAPALTAAIDAAPPAALSVSLSERAERIARATGTPLFLHHCSILR